MENLHFKILVLAISHFLLISTSYSQPNLNNLFQCLYNDSSLSSSNVVYVPLNSNSSYSSLLESTIRNNRFLTSATPKPVAIVKPSNYNQIQATVKCCKIHGVQIRIRSGGHDYEGLSYTTRLAPFVVIDLQSLNSVNVSLEDNSAWVQSGATLGEVYYAITQKSANRAFSAGICNTVGVGGHLSGGGYGTISRKYGLSADNVVDAVVINADGQILDRKSMGEDLFWAIRGGGGSSFGIILSWKIKLSEVPSVVTVFRVARTLAQGGTDLVQKWQTIGKNFTKDLFMRLVIEVIAEGNSKTIRIKFETLYLGKIDQLLAILNTNFPELGLKREDCTETSWIKSILFFGNRNMDDFDQLKNRVPDARRFFKATSDYVKQPLSKSALEMLWKWCVEGQNPILIFEPYGGIMDEIPTGNLPFPYRKGTLYNIQYLIQWDNVSESDVHINWIRKLYGNMTPFVSKGPRGAYLNYRDLDFGVNKVSGGTPYSEAEQWGSKYFGANFRRLAMVKKKVDPQNFFRDEQSIPPF
ncbi:OLC1v1024168C1 [Oldenlandia corymbosa var. corymbosa]|uniref:OLC1v1024168C1 n=1 Tax=Oldenlandia corymbosa var. corymbosa TaxID=529605 RepID=A0AAV1C446_OLDCO|nr:OLC1v1024168C1 [Oldenlandia corymbosa var. corymbosa]